MFSDNLISHVHSTDSNSFATGGIPLNTSPTIESTTTGHFLKPQMPDLVPNYYYPYVENVGQHTSHEIHGKPVKDQSFFIFSDQNNV